MVRGMYCIMNDGCIMILLRIDRARDVEGRKATVSMIEDDAEQRAKCIIYVYM